MQHVEEAIHAVLERAVARNGAAGTAPNDRVPRGVVPGAAVVAGTVRDCTGTVVAGVRKLGGLSVTPDTRFDLASLTKVIATLPSVLALAADGELDLDDEVRRFFSNAGWFQQPTLADVTVRQLLNHTSGLPAWKPLFSLVSERSTAVANALQTGLEATPGTRTTYSDLGFIVLGAIVERVSGQRLDTFVRERVFGPLGLEALEFRPVGGSADRLASTDGEQIEAADTDAPVDTVPAVAPVGPARAAFPVAATEDCGWRGMLLEGVVHDENAYAMGGVAGHAGLFGTAADVATYAQTWLRATLELPAGTSRGAGRKKTDRRDAGKLPFSTEIAAYCVSEHARSPEETQTPEIRRGLGWQLASRTASAGGWASDRSFGHTGFTGTSMWIDPQAGWFAVLLTNRVHPDRFHGEQIGELRQILHDRVAEAMLESGIGR